MSLSQNLIDEFVKVTKDEAETKKETTVFGTTVENEGKIYVQLDGAERLTPVVTTADTKPGERVSVMIKNHTATITGNFSSPAARTGDVQESKEHISAESARIDTIIADNVTINNKLTAESGRIDNLVSDNVEIRSSLSANSANIADLQAEDVLIKNRLTANEADIETLTGNTAAFQDLTTSQLTAIQAEIERLEAGEIDVEQLKATFATVAALDVEKGRINDLTAELGDINALIFGSASGSSIQTTFANAVIAQLGDAQIKSAMIKEIDAGKINSGDINTNNVRIKSADGKLLVSDETIQISDSTRVRVQIGKDASNDYSINIWDAAGKLMFSEGGITDSAIKEAIIRNEMVSDDANIAASKLDIDSLFDEINGSSNTIKSTKVYLDEEKQTLDMAFKTMTTNVTELETSITTQKTDIQAIQGQISSKIWQQDINAAKDEIGNTTDTLATKYSEVQQSINSMSATMNSYETTLSKKADATTVTTVSDKVNSLESNLDGYKTTVSNTYATKTEVTDVTGTVTAVNTRVNSLETDVNQNASDITAVATRTTSNESTIAELELAADGLTLRLNNQTIGGVNLLRGTNQEQALGSSSSWSAGTWRVAGSGTGTRMSIDITNAPNPSIKYGFQISGDGSTGDSSVAQNGIPVIAGQEYTFSCYAKGKGQLKFQVGVNTYSTIRYTLEQGTPWTKYSFTFIAGEGNNLTDTGTFNVYLANNAVGNMQICGMKLEIGNIATDWTPAETEVEESIVEAGKGATNYLNFSNNGLVIGDMTSDTLGNNVCIDSDSVDIRKGNNVLATFGANVIELGKKSTESILSLCGGAGTFKVERHANTNALDVLRTDAYSYDVYNHDMFFYTGYDYQDPVINGLSSCGKFRMYSYEDTNNTDIVLSSESVDAETQHRAGFTASSKLDGTVTDEYALMWAERHDGTSWTDNHIKVLPDRTEIDKSIRFTRNNQAIYGKHYDGTFVNAFQPCNTSGNTVIGWGMYNEEKGSTNIYGKDVVLGSSLAGKVTFRPYYRKGDTITFDSIYTAGYVTNSMKNVQFFIPLSKPIIGSPTVSITSTDGFIIRQGGKYTHGSDSSTYVAPDSYSALYIRPGGIAVTAAFSNVTNALNNEPCGIAWKGSITLS